MKEEDRPRPVGQAMSIKKKNLNAETRRRREEREFSLGVFIVFIGGVEKDKRLGRSLALQQRGRY